MIGRLRGIVVEVAEDTAVLDVGGVGYVVQAGSRTLSRLPAEGDEAVVWVESITREDGTRLFGFLARDEKRAFTVLTGVQGVGPKAALSILDVLPPGELAAAVARDDRAAVARANGVGPKLAQRVVVELKGKSLGAEPVFSPNAPGVVREAAAPTVSREAVAALMGLGTAEPLARRAVEAAADRLGAEAALPALIKAALQELAR